MTIQDWFLLGLTSLISLQSKSLSRVFSNTTIEKHQFFSTQPSLWCNSHIHTWLLEKGSIVPSFLGGLVVLGVELIYKRCGEPLLSLTLQIRHCSSFLLWITTCHMFSILKHPSFISQFLWVRSAGSTWLGPNLELRGWPHCHPYQELRGSSRIIQVLAEFSPLWLYPWDQQPRGSPSPEQFIARPFAFLPEASRNASLCQFTF